MKAESGNEFAAWIGIDWGDSKHDYCLQAAGATMRESGVLAHRPEAIAEWVTALQRRFPGRIAVCLEIAKGPLVHALQRYPALVLFPVNPATLAKYREAFTPSGAKDDPSDAELALDLLLRHGDKVRPLCLESDPLRILAGLVEERRRLVDDRTRITNRLTGALKDYYPQALEWFADKDTALFCDFLSRWPTLPHVKRARRTVLVAFFREHHVRRTDLIETRIAAIRAAGSLTDDPAVIRPRQLLVQALVAQLRVSLQGIGQFDREIAAIAPTLPDYALFADLPGAGEAMAPRLLVAFGERRERYAGAAALQQYAGVAPVVERSGNKCWVHWRMHCPTFLRQTFIEWAGTTISRSFWAGAFYRQQRAKGSSHHAALRALAFKWIRILYRCWQDRTPYDEARYLLALQRRGSPLLAAMTTASP